MLMERHESANCPSCRSTLWFGTKEEATGWKVFYECEECPFERRVGRIPMSDVDDRNDLQSRAERMWNSD